jgi:hypothetical protein
MRSFAIAKTREEKAEGENEPGRDAVPSGVDSGLAEDFFVVRVGA